MNCHFKDEYHQKYTCVEQCTKSPLNCVYDHRCRKQCYEDCGNCNEIIENVKLKCGH
jgi:hypothetical protein